MDILVNTHDELNSLEMKGIDSSDEMTFECRVIVKSNWLSCNRQFFFDHFNAVNFLRSLKSMNSALTGSAELTAKYDDQIISISCLKHGKVIVKGEFIEHSELAQKLVFAFETDQTILPSLITEFGNLLNNSDKQEQYIPVINKEQFYVLLIAASYESLKFGSKYIDCDLSWHFLYEVHLNCSHDVDCDNHYDTYPQEDPKIVKKATHQQVIDLLFRNGKCPVWIDIQVFKRNNDFTLLKLECAGRYTDEYRRFYYNKTGFGPFGIKGPTLPPSWEEGQKFKIDKC